MIQSNLYPEMEPTGRQNYLSEVPDIDDYTMRKMAKAILVVALRDLKYTQKSDRPHKTYTSPSIHEHIRIGEEVRDWFNDTESWDLFSFRNVCDLAGRDYKKILKKYKKYMKTTIPLSKVCVEDTVVEELLKHPDGCTMRSMFVNFRSRGLVVRNLHKLFMTLYRRGHIVRFRRRVLREGSKVKDISLWKLTEDGRRYAEITRKAKESVPSIQDKRMDRQRLHS